MRPLFPAAAIYTVTISLVVLFRPLVIGSFFEQNVLNLKSDRCSSKSKDVAACIHKYLEKDFISIMPIVYPKSKVRKAQYQCVNSQEYERKNHVLMDGPTLANSCNDLHHVFDCMLDELAYCDSLDSFFHVRHLVYSLKKVINWLCGRPTLPGEQMSDSNQHTNVRLRFLGLLESINCVECVRTNQQVCMSQTSSPSALEDVSLWHNILRLEIGMERCNDIKEKMSCLQRNDLLLRSCGPRASEIHRNLTDLFLTTWCDTAPFSFSNSYTIKLSIFLLAICLLLSH